MSSESTPSLPAIPGYRLLERIGEGGTGQVLRAERLEPRGEVAIKFLNPFPHSPVPQASVFLRETHLMGSLSHPNIVAIYDCGQLQGRFYIVMEYVPGQNLRWFMQPGEPWPIDRILLLVNSIARALTYIHSQDILHLDLKPENVICDGPNYKITDFGLALNRVDAWTLSELGLAEGTLDYCSPEQRFGLPIDQRSDLFSLATLSYELLTGSLPSRVYVPATKRNAQLPAAVDEVLRRALMRDKDDRYPDVESFRADLERALTR